MRIVRCCCILAMTPVTALAHEDAPVLTALLTWAVPLVIFIGILLFLLKRMKLDKSIELQNDLLEEAPGHMQRLEDKLDRMIALLEEIRDARR